MSNDNNGTATGESNESTASDSFALIPRLTPTHVPLIPSMLDLSHMSDKHLPPSPTRVQSLPQQSNPESPEKDETLAANASGPQDSPASSPLHGDADVFGIVRDVDAEAEAKALTKKEMEQAKRKWYQAREKARANKYAPVKSLDFEMKINNDESSGVSKGSNTSRAEDEDSMQPGSDAVPVQEPSQPARQIEDVEVKELSGSEKDDGVSQSLPASAPVANELPTAIPNVQHPAKASQSRTRKTECTRQADEPQEVFSHDREGETACQPNTPEHLNTPKKSSTPDSTSTASTVKLQSGTPSTWTSSQSTPVMRPISHDLHVAITQGRSNALYLMLQDHTITAKSIHSGLRLAHTELQKVLAKSAALRYQAAHGISESEDAAVGMGVSGMPEGGSNEIFDMPADAAKKAITHLVFERKEVEQDIKKMEGELVARKERELVARKERVLETDEEARKRLAEKSETAVEAFMTVCWMVVLGVLYVNCREL